MSPLETDRHRRQPTSAAGSAGRVQRVVGIALLLLAVLTLAACSSTDAGAPADGAAGAAGGDSSTTTAPAGGGAPPTTAARPACSAATLGASVSSTADAKLVDVVCETTFAAATLTNGPNGEEVVAFTLAGDAWTMVGAAPVSGDPAAAAPADFSATAIPAWARLRAARLARAEGGSGSASGQAGSSSDPLARCREEGDVHICPDPPTTLAPPPDPDAPPTTATQSNFCKYNYNDPRCQADPGFQP